jgi:septal ring factor EnvC (AmiA/AmiB activator)|tara:strand:- start:270 stop:467 length:198 start_codon:yes stop_codon:yes gene_type:complete
MKLERRTVIQTEINQLEENQQKLREVVSQTEIAIQANDILIEGLNENLASLPEQLEIVDPTNTVE